MLSVEQVSQLSRSHAGPLQLAPVKRYMPMCSVGLVMGKHSGRHALATRLRELGFELAEEQLNDVFKRFKALADVKKGITDEDISALAGDEAHQPTTIWELQDLQARRRPVDKLSYITGDRAATYICIIGCC